MASTFFVDNQTIIYADWLNDVNDAVYNGTFQATTISPTNLICNGTVSGTGFDNLFTDIFSEPDPIGDVTPNSGAFTTLTSTTTTSLGGTALAIRGLNFSHGEIVWVPESGTLNILNLCDSTGSNGSNYALLVRGLASNGSTGANLASVDFNTNSFLINGSLIGVGVTTTSWHGVTGSRSLNASYTNSRSYPIMVNVSVSYPNLGANTVVFSVGGQPVAYEGGNASTDTSDTVSFIVPPNTAYSSSVSQGTVNLVNWAELY